MADHRHCLHRETDTSKVCCWCERRFRAAPASEHGPHLPRAATPLPSRASALASGLQGELPPLPWRPGEVPALPWPPGESPRAEHGAPILRARPTRRSLWAWLRRRPPVMELYVEPGASARAAKRDLVSLVDLVVLVLAVAIFAWAVIGIVASAP